MPTGLLGTYFPGEDPMAPVDLMPTGLLGPSVLSRMKAHGDRQRQRMAAGDYSPTPVDEEAMWLADDLAGGLLGPIGLVGATARRALPRFTAERAPANFRTVTADVGKLDEAWRAGPDWVGDGSEIPGRRERFREWLGANPDEAVRTSEIGGLQRELVRDSDGSPVRLPDGTYKTVQVPVFSDGRHRFSVLRDEGQETIPVSVSDRIADEFIRLFGAR